MLLGKVGESCLLTPAGAPVARQTGTAVPCLSAVACYRVEVDWRGSGRLERQVIWRCHQ